MDVGDIIISALALLFALGVIAAIYGLMLLKEEKRKKRELDAAMARFLRGE